MSDEVGKGLRQAFIEMLRDMGSDCQAGGEKRRALTDDEKTPGATVFDFAEEFPLKVGDKIKVWASETNFTVIKARPVAEANVFQYFEVTARADG